jgi:aspartokinase
VEELFLETIAVYWESTIKVYGISIKQGLVLVQISFPIENIEKIGRKLLSLDDSAIRFELITQDYIDPEHQRLNLVLDETNWNAARVQIEQWTSAGKTTLDISPSMELVFLHGPHFQDRYGIVEAVFSSLIREQIDIILGDCAGTSVYLLFRKGHGLKAHDILNRTFIIPTVS